MGEWRRSLYGLLDHPALYRATRLLLAPGAESGIGRVVEDLLRELPAPGRTLDVGCGPWSWLFSWGLNPVGIDCSSRYMSEFAQSGRRAVVGSADVLPFSSRSFDSVWSMGLLHHLPPSAAAQTVAEMVRVCRPGGVVVLVDAVLPVSGWRRPLAYLLRRLDRGRFVRREEQLRSMLAAAIPFEKKWRRVTFSLNGMELLTCWSQIPR